MKIGIGISFACIVLLGACGASEPEADAAQPAPAPRAAASAPAGAASAQSTATLALSSPDSAPAAEVGAARDAPPATPSSAERTNPDAAAILSRAEKAYASVRSLQADFIQDLTVPLLDQTQRSRGTMYHRRPDRFLMKFSEPAGDVVVADGQSLWLYYPSTDAKQVIRTTLSEGGHEVDLQREFLSNPTARFNATLDGTESVGGRSAHLLTLTPKQSSPYTKVRLWVDQQDALVRRFEITEQNGTVRRLELHSLQSNVTLPNRLFSFAPPPGAQVYQQ
jgi:outer membrane lipoprotein carrier protein